MSIEILIFKNILSKNFCYKVFLAGHFLKYMKKIILLFLLFAGSVIHSQTVAISSDLIYKVNLPLKKSEKTPVIIMLHGYGSNEEDLFALAKSFDTRFITFSLRAPFIAEGQGFSWYKLEFLPDKKFKYDYKEVKTSREKILSFISNACKIYKADSTQVFIMGFSQGAIMAYDLSLFKPEKIKGVLALSGKLLEESKKIKFDALKVSKVKFFIAHGNMDNVIEYKEAEEASKFFQNNKNNVTFKTYEMPHSINGKELNDIKTWLKGNIEKEKKEDQKK
jgi:phospholipase/carboxylesterase